MLKQIRHIAVIPDGNRRWAKSKGKFAFEGHTYAAEHTMPALYDSLIKHGISYCTLWAISPENYIKRNKNEINNLLKLLHYSIYKRIDEMCEKGICIKVIGNTTIFPENIQKDLDYVVQKTKNNSKLTLIFALNYGGRDEILRAFNTILNSKQLHKSISKEKFEEFLDTKGIPDPDLIIRVGGEKRTSGFLLWQSEYAEYIFMDKYFPDFTPSDLKSCILEYEKRQRRFGK